MKNVKKGTVRTTRSLRFSIFWEIFENCQLKTLENSSDRYRFFDNMDRNDLVVGIAADTRNSQSKHFDDLYFDQNYQCFKNFWEFRIALAFSSFLVP